MATTAPGRRYAGRSDAERRAERRARILDAGLELFGTDGFLSTSIEALCNAAGVSTRSFYEEFASREELLTALHDMANQHALQAVTDALAAAPADSVEARAGAAARAFVSVMTADPRWSRVAYVEIVGISPDLEARRRFWMSRWASLVAGEGTQLAALGLGPQRDFSLTAIGLVGAINELVSEWLSHKRRPALDAVVAEIVRLLAAGLRAP